MPGLAPSQITHENQYTTMDLSYNLAPNVSMGEAKAIIDATVAGMRMPGDIRLADDAGFGFNSDPSDMLILVLAAILTVYLVLGMLYESLIHPVTILSTLPAAGVGALLALFGTNTELSVISMIALVLLIGIVKKNAIMMIDFALVAQREHGLAPHDAAREASIVRFRPIMMTTMVAILAAVPLAIGLGEGSELRRPLGIAMIGGLLFSQSLTLLSTPALYVISRAWPSAGAPVAHASAKRSCSSARNAHSSGRAGRWPALPMHRAAKLPASGRHYRGANRLAAHGRRVRATRIAFGRAGRWPALPMHRAAKLPASGRHYRGCGLGADRWPARRVRRRAQRASLW